MLHRPSPFKLLPPAVRDDGCCRADRRPPLRSTNCARAHRAFSPRPPPLASWHSCPPEKLSSLRDVLGPSPFRRDRGRSGRCLPGAYAKHLVAFFGDAFLGVPVSRLVSGGHQPQVCPYRTTLFEAVGIFQGEHERERRERPNPIDLAQELRLWIALLGDRLKLAVVLADALGKRAYLCSSMGPRAGVSASGMCSAARLWKLLAGHLGKRAPKDLTAPRTLGSRAGCGNRPTPASSGSRPYEPGTLRPGA
jgi:hypothetical protein